MNLKINPEILIQRLKLIESHSRAGHDIIKILLAFCASMPQDCEPIPATSYNEYYNCEYCHKEIHPKDNYCWYCGKKINWSKEGVCSCYSYGRCYGTKECDPCSCGGRVSKCDFYREDEKE